MTDGLGAIILDQADRLLRQEVTKERLEAADRGEFAAALWETVTAAGLPLALVPEAEGGSGLEPAEAMRLVRRSAYHILPAPLAETMLACGLWTAAGGAAPDGAVSLAPVNAEDRITIRRTGGGHALSGTARRVPWMGEAAHVLLFARDAAGNGFVALLPRPALNAPASRNLAGEPRAALALDGTEIAAELVRPAPNLCAEGFLEAGAMLRAQQMVGAMERALDHALVYAGERKQFGRPIGKFQAVQHMLAEAAGQFAAAAAATDLAAEAFGMPGFALATAIAKARAGEAAGKVAEICHQVHGAMGFTQEHPLHHATRRLWSWRDEFGHESLWQERIGRLVCAGGGEALWPMLAGA